MATIGVTAKLEYENGSGWAEVEKCKSISFPSIAVNPYETTHLGITDYAKTYSPGLIDAGVIAFEAEYTSTTYAAWHGLLRDELGWRVSAPSGEGDVLTCDGHLTKLEVTMTPDAEVMITGEIKLSGLPALS